MKSTHPMHSFFSHFGAGCYEMEPIWRGYFAFSAGALFAGRPDIMDVAVANNFPF